MISQLIKIYDEMISKCTELESFVKKIEDETGSRPRQEVKQLQDLEVAVNNIANALEALTHERIERVNLDF